MKLIVCFGVIIVLVKYYGFFFDESARTYSLRSEFIENGLFRITQPKFLNDKGSEMRVYPYFKEFAPADYEWAREKYEEINTTPSHSPSIEELESMFLRPFPHRLISVFPEGFGYPSVEDFDNEQLNKIAEKINSTLIELLSCHIGVLSLSKSDKIEHMWTHYANEGKGLAVTFDESHPFFRRHNPIDVEYADTREKRIPLTYFNGRLSLNGVPFNKFKEVGSLEKLLGFLLQDQLDIKSLYKGLLFTKADTWRLEDEVRIICRLQQCDERKGGLCYPDLGFELPSEILQLNGYCKVNLLKIPFDAFESIVFGFDMSPSDKLAIEKKVRGNEALRHLKLREAKHNIYGKIEIV